MKLISCDNCGVVLDGEKLNFGDDEDIWDEDKCEYMQDRSVWCNETDKFVPVISCPVCKAPIKEQ